MPIPLALVPRGDSVGYVSLGDGVLLCDSEVVASVADNSVAGLAYTAEDVPLLAWVPRGLSARPYFAFKTDRWRTRRLPGQTGMGGIDIETSSDNEVVIVFSTQGAGLWCAMGTDVLEVRETPSAEVRTPDRGPTVLSGASSVRRLASCVLFDATGRRVTVPRAGVYFVREGRSSEVRRVVVVR